MFMEAPGLNTVSETYAVAFDPFTPAAAGAPIATCPAFKPSLPLK